ncbi:hypothetical protein V8C86DRAFT_2466364 [Haematococcus lacustris]
MCTAPPLSRLQPVAAGGPSPSLLPWGPAGSQVNLTPQHITPAIGPLTCAGSSRRSEAGGEGLLLWQPPPMPGPPPPPQPPWSGPQTPGHMGSGHTVHGQVRPEPTMVVGSRGRHSSSSRALARIPQLQQATLLSRGLSRASGRVLQRAGRERDREGILAELSRLGTTRLLLLGAAGVALSLNVVMLAFVSAGLLLHWLLH